MRKKFIAYGIALAISLTTVMSASGTWIEKYKGATISCSSQDLFAGWLFFISWNLSKCHGCLVSGDGAMSPTIAINTNVGKTKSEYDTCKGKGKRTEADIYTWTHSYVTQTTTTRVKTKNHQCVDR